MTSTTTTRIALACTAVAAPLLIAAPVAHAAPVSGACLVVENNTPNSFNVTLNNRSFRGSNWTISPWDHTLLTHDGRAISTSDGDWSLNGPAGDWHYEAGRNNAQWGCNGSWVFVVG